MNRRGMLLSACAFTVSAVGCHHFYAGPRRPPQIEVPLANPFQVGPADPALVWAQVVDAVDDYFRIKSETPVRRDNAAWLEGRLETFPEVGGTIFEPWRTDSTRGFERLQSTFKPFNAPLMYMSFRGPMVT